MSTALAKTVQPTPNRPDALIGLDGVTFQYKSRPGCPARGVRSLAFEVHGGEVAGLVGPNGAGKTTTIKLLAGLLLPHQGDVRFDGCAVGTRHLRTLRRNVGFAQCGERGLYPRLSVRDNLRLFASLQQLPRKQARQRVDYVLDSVGLSQVAADDVNRLSRGMRQRLHIARAMLHEPRVLLVDEPTLGLDPDSARGVRLLLKSLASAGVAIVIATNYLPEAASLCARLTVLTDGATAFDGEPQELMNSCADTRVIEAVFPVPVPAERVHEALVGQVSVHVVQRGDLCLVEILAGAGCDITAERLHDVLQLPAPIWHAERAPNLEDAYTLLMQRLIEREVH